MTVKPLDLIKFSLLISLFLLFLIEPVSSQETQKDTTSTRVEFGEIEAIEEIEERDTEEEEDYIRERNGVTFNIGNSIWHFEDGTDIRLGLFDIGFSTYLENNSINLSKELDEFELLYNGSLNFNFHLIRHRIPIIKDHASIEYGLSFSWMSYKFANDFRIVPDKLEFTTENDGTVYKKNKLKTTFVEVPILFTLTPGKRKSFYLSGGVYGGILITSKQKLKAVDGAKSKIKDDFNLNKFRYGFVGRIGVGPLAFYAQYSLTDLFKEGQGPVLQPFNIGVTVLNF